MNENTYVMSVKDLESFEKTADGIYITGLGLLKITGKKMVSRIECYTYKIVSREPHQESEFDLVCYLKTRLEEAKGKKLNRFEQGEIAAYQDVLDLISIK